MHRAGDDDEAEVLSTKEERLSCELYLSVLRLFFFFFHVFFKGVFNKTLEVHTLSLCTANALLLFMRQAGSSAAFYLLCR